MLQRLLRRLLSDELAEAIAGDLEEGSARRRANGAVRARLWLAAAATGILLHVLRHRLTETISMSIAGGFGLRGFWRELGQAGRSLVRTPVSSAVIVLILALGLGLNTAIFSAVHGVLFEPLPFPNPDRVVVIEGRSGDQDPSRFGTSLLDFQDLRINQRTFRAMATSAYWTFTVTGLDTPLRLVGTRVSGSFFPMLGAVPALGRLIGPDDDEAGAAEVAVLSHGLWMRVFGGRTDVVGRTVSLNGVSTRIVGVMPPAFRYPAEDVEVWTAMRGQLDTVPRGSRFFVTLGRLRDDVSIAEAQADLEAVTANLAREFPDAYRDWRPVVTPALAELTADARPRLLILFAAVITVLLVACVNVAMLLVSRGSARSREFAVRAALGAGRLRLIRVPLLESAWLGAVGLAGSVLIARPAVVWLRSIAPDDIPRMDSVALSWPVLGWAAVTMIAFVLAGGLAPFIRLQRYTRGGAGTAWAAGPRSRLGRQVLVALQVGAAFALLVAAGLLTRSFERVLDVHPGFDPQNVAMARVFLTPPTYRSTESQVRFVTDALDRLAQTPGVRAAAAVSQPPFDDQGGGTTLPLAVAGRTYQPGTNPVVQYRTVSPGYFETIGMQVQHGRGFSTGDRQGAPLAAVINAAMARQEWPGEDAVGRRFTFADKREAGELTVVGVVNDVATNGLEEQEPPTVYAPYEQRSLVHLRWMTFVVRTDVDAMRRLPDIRASLQALDSNQPIYGLTTMESVMARSVAERRFSTALMLAFAGLTLLLSVLGLYGALAQVVSQRLREIGVRLAIGAQPASIFRRVVGDGLVVVSGGLLIGGVLAAMTSAQIEALLFGVTAFDPLTYAGMVVGLLLAGFVASAIPALRASRVDPAVVLRKE